MVGRTPEYLGKKIRAPDVKLATLYVLAVPTVTLVFAGIAAVLSTAVSQLGNTRPARPVGDPLLVRVGGQRQRLGVPGHHRDVALVPAVARRSRSSSAGTC